MKNLITHISEGEQDIFENAFYEKYGELDDDYSILVGYGDIDKTFKELGNEEYVNVNDIVSAQTEIDDDKLYEYVGSEVYDGGYGLRFNGDSEVMLLDGNHRVCAAICNDVDDVKMIIIEL